MGVQLVLFSWQTNINSNSVMKTLLLLAFLGFVSAQDTHYCPDGWHLSDFGDAKECILLGGIYEKMTKADAFAICQSKGAWLVDLDEGHGGDKNSFVKDLKDQDVFGYGVYHWNDWGCGYVARYICEK